MFSTNLSPNWNACQLWPSALGPCFSRVLEDQGSVLLALTDPSHWMARWRRRLKPPRPVQTQPTHPPTQKDPSHWRPRLVRRGSTHSFTLRRSEAGTGPSELRDLATRDEVKELSRSARGQGPLVDLWSGGLGYGRLFFGRFHWCPTEKRRF